MKLLLAVKGCERDAARGLHRTIRETWGRDVHNADLRFFVGAGRAPLEPDEVRLACPDDYQSLPLKTLAILRWSLANGYDFTFLCDTDTFVIPARLLASGFESYDLTGLFNGLIGVPNATERQYWAWISGGNGYWLSRRAAEIIVTRGHDGDWAEDRMVGQALGPWFALRRLSALSHPGYGFHTDGNEWLTRVTSHFCTMGYKRQFDPTWMRRRYDYNRANPIDLEAWDQR